MPQLTSQHFRLPTEPVSALLTFKNGVGHMRMVVT